MEKENGIVQINDSFDADEAVLYMKTFMFIKGYAVGKGNNQTLIALSVARRLHDRQFRNDGTPYICHPLKVCSTLISYGIGDDVTLAAALLHDVLEDCSERLPNGGKDLEDNYGISSEIVEIVKLLTKKSGLNDHELGLYFKKISLNPKASLIKLSDRQHNSSTVYRLPRKKIRKYLRETDIYLIPLASYCKKYYPEYGNAFSILKTNIKSMNNIMISMLKKTDSSDIIQDSDIGTDSVNTND